MEVKLTVRIPKTLHIAIKVKAAQEDRTVSDVVRTLLQRWLEEEPRDKPPPP